MIYNTTKGPIEIWTLLYLSPPSKSGHRITLGKKLFRVDQGESAALRAHELKRTLKGPAAIPQWDEMREADGSEVSEYFKRHPELMTKNTAIVTGKQIGRAHV